MIKTFDFKGLGLDYYSSKLSNNTTRRVIVLYGNSRDITIIITGFRVHIS